MTEVWNEYQRGIDFKNSINLFRTVDENIRFDKGDQWKGCNAPDLPKPVFNIIKPIRRFKTVQVKDRKLAMNYTTEGEAQDVRVLLNIMNDYSRRTWNRLQMEIKNLDGLGNAFNTGDYILYHWWNKDIETGQPFTGDIDCAIVDNVNYFPANPNLRDVQTQPYIILCMRDTVENVRRKAKANGVSAEKIKLIVADEDTEYTAGETGKIEVDKGDKCNVLLRMWKNGGGPNRQVYFSMHTKNVDIQPETRAHLKLYPISMMNWETETNCCHGTAETTALINNQVYVNKQMAFTQLFLLQTAYPKVIYDKNAFPNGWSNKVVSAVGANRQNGPITDLAHYMNPPQLPADIWKGFTETIAQTMSLAGANDAALGNIPNPDNKAAFIAVRDASVVPLIAQQQRYHQMMQDTGLIWLDFVINHYPDGRMIPLEEDGEIVNIPLEMAPFKNLVYDVKLEVGESQMWNELNVVSTLDNLLMGKQITLSQYLERMPTGYIPEKDKLIQEVKVMEQQAQALQQQMPTTA